MAAVTSELMYEVLKKIQTDMSELKEGQREANSRLNALTTHLIAPQQDVSNVYATLVRPEGRLDRIECRLELTEVS
jgi:hypothetical protein